MSYCLSFFYWFVAAILVMRLGEQDISVADPGFPRRGMPTPKMRRNLSFWPISSKNGMKIIKIGLRWSMRLWCPSWIRQ